MGPCLAVIAALVLPGSALGQAAPAPGVAPLPDMPRATFIQQMDAEFQRRDADRDGRVTQAEMARFEQQVAQAAMLAENRRTFTTLDANRDGLLSPEEFATSLRPVPQPDVSQQMRRFDTNRDQVIGLVEYRAATLANFDRLDTDLDMVVTAAEMAAGQTRSAAPAPSGR